MPDSAPSNVVMASTGAEPKSWLEKNVVPIIGLTMVIGSLAIISFAPDNKAKAIIPLLTFVLGYYFGTGAGSQAKDKIIATLKGNGGSK